MNTTANSVRETALALREGQKITIFVGYDFRRFEVTFAQIGSRHFYLTNEEYETLDAYHANGSLEHFTLDHVQRIELADAN